MAAKFFSARVLIPPPCVPFTAKIRRQAFIGLQDFSELFTIKIFKNMKNLFLTLALAVATFQALFSQQYGEPGFIIGLNVGAQTTSFKWSDDYQDLFLQQSGTSYDARPKIGFSGGVRLGYKLSRGFTAFTNVSFERSFFVAETRDNFYKVLESGDTLVGLVKITESVNRISFPLMAKVRVLGDDGGLTVTAGMDMSRGLKGKRNSVIFDGVKTSPVDDSKEFTLGGSRFDEYVGFNVGFLLGIGGEIPIGENLYLTLDLQKKWGFTDQYTDERKTYLSQTEGVDIQGSKFLSGMHFFIGFQKTLGATY